MSISYNFVQFEMGFQCPNRACSPAKANGSGEALERGRSLRIVIGKCSGWVAGPSRVVECAGVGMRMAGGQQEVSKGVSWERKGGCGDGRKVGQGERERAMNCHLRLSDLPMIPRICQ